MGRIELIRILEDGSIAGDDIESTLILDEISQDVCETTSEAYKTRGFEEPWLSYLAIVDGSCVGTCGFRAPPELGRIEIECYTFPEFEGRGVATEMTEALVQIALKENRDLTVAAYTEPSMGASARVLEKNGFSLVGLVGHQEDGDVWEWVLSREYH